MANIKSQKKRAVTNLKRANAKQGEKTALKTAIKNVLAATDKESGTKALNDANKLLDKAVSNHIKHDNYAARQKSRLQKHVNGLK